MVAALALVVLAGGCAAPLGVGLPSTREVESGAAWTLDHAASFEIKGSYVEDGVTTSLELQLARRNKAQRALFTSSDLRLETIVIGTDAYFRGQEFAAARLGPDAISQGVARAAGTGWWRGSTTAVPDLPDFTGGAAFRSAFLGPAVERRTDGVNAGGVPAIEMSGQRDDVYLAAGDPHQVLRARLAPGVTVDGVSGADFWFGSYNRDFGIAAPSPIIDFSNLSSAPPIYTVSAVQVSSCGSACTVTAALRNLGGVGAAARPSQLTITVTDPATGALLGSCSQPVAPNVGFNAITRLGCVIEVPPLAAGAARATAVVDNPA